MPTARAAWSLVLRRCLQVAALPTAAAAVLALVMHHTAPVATGDALAGAAAAPWLSLPLVTAMLTTGLAAAVFWPGFSRGRPGAEWLRHRQPGRLGGNGGAILGALLAQWLLSLPIALLLAPALAAPAIAHAHLELTPSGPAQVDQGTAPLVFRIPGGTTFLSLQLRPQAGLPRGPLVATELAVAFGGEPLPTRAQFSESRQLATVPLPAGQPTTEALTLTRIGGTVPLYFGPGSAVLVASAPQPGWWNALLLTLVALAPAFVALALACLVGAVASLPTVLAVLASIGFLLTIGDVGPFGPAGRALLRGQWLPAGEVFPACWPLVAVGSLAMVAVMVLRPRSAR
jgi:hypothetical protein